MDETCLTEGIYFESRYFAGLVCDGDYVEIMLLEEQTLIYIVLIALEFFLYDELRYIKHDLGAELMNIKELDHRL